MKNFEELLQKELDKLPYTKHLDDGQYNDGQVVGFENGARWALSLFTVSWRSEQLRAFSKWYEEKYKFQISEDAIKEFESLDS